MNTLRSAKVSPFDSASEESKSRSKARFTWKFKGIKQLFEKIGRQNSEHFYCGFIRWCISIETNKVGDQKSLGVYLRAEDLTDRGTEISCKTSFEFRLLNRLPRGPDKVSKLSYEFKSVSGFGLPEFIDYSELFDPLKGHLNDDELVVQINLKTEKV